MFSRRFLGNLSIVNLPDMNPSSRRVGLVTTMCLALGITVAGHGCTSTDAATPAATTDRTVPETTPTVPVDVLVAVPQQNREDPAKQQFQVQVVNGTDERFEVRSVQFVWDGFTTPTTPRDSTIVAGQTIDFPVPFPGATCNGSGDLDSMPALDEAVVLIGLDDGSVRRVPVIDRWHLARRLYLDDCERQHIESMVALEWTDLHADQLDGRPITVGALRLSRRSATGTVTVRAISGTIPYAVDTVTTEVGEAVVVLAEGDAVASAPIRIVEGRCDPHALAEVKQPHRFVAQIDLGDGVEHPYTVVPPASAWVPMRHRADEACVLTGKVTFVGDG